MSYYPAGLSTGPGTFIPRLCSDRVTRLSGFLLFPDKKHFVFSRDRLTFSIKVSSRRAPGEAAAAAAAPRVVLTVTDSQRMEQRTKTLPGPHVDPLIGPNHDRSLEVCVELVCWATFGTFQKTRM